MDDVIFESSLTSPIVCLPALLPIPISLAQQCLLQIKHEFPDNLEVSQRSQTAEETDTLSLCWIKIYPCYIW